MNDKRKEIDSALESLDMDTVMNTRAKQVRYFYQNSNKCTLVINEKLVRLMIHKLQTRIQELENKI